MRSLDFNRIDPVYIRPGYTDLRKGIDGLCLLVQSSMKLDPRQNILFIMRSLDFNRIDPVYIRPGYTDLRKGIDGLCLLVQSSMKLDPRQNILFLFCGRKTSTIKGPASEYPLPVLRQKDFHHQRTALGRGWVHAHHQASRERKISMAQNGGSSHCAERTGAQMAA